MHYSLTRDGGEGARGALMTPGIPYSSPVSVGGMLIPLLWRHFGLQIPFLNREEAVLFHVELAILPKDFLYAQGIVI